MKQLYTQEPPQPEEQVITSDGKHALTLEIGQGTYIIRRRMWLGDTRYHQRRGEWVRYEYIKLSPSELKKIAQ